MSVKKIELTGVEINTLMHFITLHGKKMGPTDYWILKELLSKIL